MLSLRAPTAAAFARAIQTSPHRRLVRQGLVALILFQGALLIGLTWADHARRGIAVSQDCQSFIQAAEAMRFFYDSGVREPFYVLGVKLFVAAGRPFGLAPPTAIRLLSAVSTLGLIGMTYLVGRRFFHAAIGLAAAWLVAINPLFLLHSVGGLRLPLFTSLLLGLVLVLFRPAAGKRTWWPAGLLGAALVLTRLNALSLVLLLFALQWAVVRGREPFRAFLRRQALGLALVVGLSLPYPIYCQVSHGQFFLPVNIAARHFLNLEMVARGELDPEVVLANATAGEPVTFREFLFYQRGPVGLLGRVAANAGLLFTVYLPATWRFLPGGFALAVLGMLALGFHPLRVHLGVGLVTAVPVLAFLHLRPPLPGVISMDLRFVLHTFPFLCYYAGFAVWVLLLWVRGAGGGLEDRPAPAPAAGGLPPAGEPV